MQHYALIRDLELTILDPDDLLQGLLPLGRRREPWSSLKRADWIVFRSADPIDPLLRKKLHIEFKPHARFSYVVSGWRNNHLLYPDCRFLKERSLGLCTGVARPQKVIDLLKDEGIYPEESFLLADHENLDYESLLSLEIKWKERGLSYAICTEKDYARWSQKSPLSDFWIYPELSLNWHEGEKELLDAIKQRLNACDY
jgi:tetraacyldisaccharide-1-P 4'-kinase